MARSGSVQGWARAGRFLRVAMVAVVMTAAASLLSASGTPAPAHAGTSQPRTAAQSRPAGQPRPASPLAGVAAYLGSRTGVVQVALYDRLTGRTSLLSTGTATQYTASIVKADIPSMWLRRYQGRALQIPDDIPFSIKYLMTNMITLSDNVAATSLFYFGGGCSALTQFNTLIPTRATTVGCQTPTYYGWGNTTTIAADQARIVRTLAYPNRVLAPDARAYGLHLMENVTPTQRWGVTCGPWGTSCDPPDYATPVPGVTVAVKNGWKFVPTCTRQDDTCPWQVNSIGWVHGADRDYVLAVLTTDDPIGPGVYGFNYGITTIQGVSQLVWDNLAP
jgi:Beta-lactamase enzyme family